MADIHAPESIGSIDDAVIESDFDPGQGMADHLNDYHTYMSGRYAALSQEDYLPPYIVEAVWPMDSADLGLSDEQVWAVDDGVMVIVPCAKGRAEGDLVRLQWGDATVAVERVSHALGDEPVTLNVSSDDVPEGLHPLAYTLERDGQVYARSHSASVLVRYGQPGAVAEPASTTPAAGSPSGGDQATGDGGSGTSNTGPAPGTNPGSGPGSSTTAPPPGADSTNPFAGAPRPGAPKPSLPASGSVTHADLANGIAVTVPAWPTMRQGDVITLKWGDETVEYKVQPGDIGKPVTIRVGRATLLAGGGDDQVSVSYYITTAPAWESQWSSEASVPVRLASQDYPAPSVVDPKAPEKNFTVSLVDLDDIKGLDLIIKVDTVMGFKPGDTVKLYWETTDATGNSSVTVVGSESVVVVGRTLRFTLVHQALLKLGQGRACVYYEVYSGTSIQTSRPWLVHVSASGAGQNGQAGGSPVGPPLGSPKPLAAPAAPAKVNADDAGKGVVVTVAPYANMREHDRVYLYWGDEIVEHKVLAADVGKPLGIAVPAATIIAAGASDRLPVAYYVEDEVGNESEWSYETDVSVELKKATYPAPSIVDPMDPDNNVAVSAIDLDRIHGTDLVIKIDTPEPFAAQDTVTLYWVTSNEAGESTTLALPAQVVSTVGRTLRFTVPYSAVANVGKGHAHAYYEVGQGGTAQRSPSAFVDIDGALQALPAPLLSEAVEGSLDADTTLASVLVPATAGLRAGDKVQVLWKGMAVDGTPLVKLSPWRTVTSNGAGKGLVLRFKPAECVKPLDGGQVTLSYTLKRKSGVIEKSAPAVVEIGDLPETLAPPTLDPATPGDLLDPSRPEFKLGADVNIPPIATIAPPYTLTLIWTTSEGGYYEDSQAVEAGDEPSPFSLDPELFKSQTGKPLDVEVYYIVERDGYPAQASTDLAFRVAEPHMLVPPLAVSQGTMVFDWVCIGTRLHLGADRIDANRRLPATGRMMQRRKPTGGSPPYTYRSDNTQVAQVDAQGTVTIKTSGTARISVTDSRNQAVSYPLRASNIFCMHLGEVRERSHPGAVNWQRMRGCSPCTWHHTTAFEANWGKPVSQGIKGLQHWWMGMVQQGKATFMHNGRDGYLADPNARNDSIIGVLGAQHV